MRNFWKLLQRADKVMKYEDEDCLFPNILAKLNAVKIYLDIYNNHEFEPVHVGYGKDGFVHLKYIYYSPKKKLSLVIETYNDGESAIIVNDDTLNNTLFLEDIYDLNFDKAINFFKEKMKEYSK